MVVLLRWFPRLVIALLSFVLLCMAQQPAPPRPPDEAAQRELVFRRVQGLGARIAGFRDDLARVQGLGLLGQYTCAASPELARSFFETAVEIARPMRREAADESAAVPLTRNSGIRDLRSARSQAWESLLTRIASCLPDFAYQLNQQEEKSAKRLGDPVSDLRIARDLARKSPEKAVEFANRAVSGRITEDMLRSYLVYVLFNLQENSRPQADALFLRILDLLAAELRADGTRLLLLGNYLFGPPMRPEIPPTSYSAGFLMVGKVFVPNIMAPRPWATPQLARRYLETSLNILSRPSEDARQMQVDYAAAFQMRAQSSRFAPELVPLFDGLMQRLTTQVPVDVPQQSLRLERTFDFPPAASLEEYERELDPQRRERMRGLLFQS